MTYDHFFSGALGRLHAERCYRVFADLERVAGRFPHAYGILRTARGRSRSRIDRAISKRE